MSAYEIVVFVSWLAALWGVISASVQKRSAFESIGHTKWKWVAINVLGLIIPYLGIVTAAVYGFRVFRHLPTRSGNIKQQFGRTRSRSAVGQNPPGYSQQPTAPAEQAGFAGSAPRPTEPGRIPCSACGTSGRVNTDQVCFPCGGEGYL